ncbi:MAG: mandelate racemase/muconate lactonizing enzyme family protein [Myxococcales bacterium]|nr:mandelate racemase/muconate lactonizing enzyme family protein [Myxococcales bacterium]
MTWFVAPWGGDVSGVASARRTYPRRDGLLVVLRDAEGTLGFGEATPLPGFGDDELERARAELVPAALPAPVDDLDAIPSLLSGFRSASARFAVETALLDRLARHRGMALSALLGARTLGAPRSVLVGALGDDGFLEAARLALRRGARALKLKALGRELGEESRRLGELRRALGPETELRLDLNGSLDAAHAREALVVYTQHGVALCEEPTAGAELLRLGREATPWLADESALGPEAFARFVAHPGCAGVVLKPGAIGGLGRTLERVRALRAAGKHALLSHAFEGPVALGAAAELALAAGGALGHGVDRHAALAAFPAVELPQLPESAPLSIVRAPVAGLGLTLEGPWTSSD